MPSAERVGAGPPVVLVHGSLTGAGPTWREQLPLAERWTLVLLDRPGFGASPPLGRVDFEREAPLVAEALGEGAHLVAHSYGGVVALLAAALRPQAVRSLTVVEPPAFGVAAGDPAVDAFVAEAKRLFAQELEPGELARSFLELVGSAAALPDPLPPALERGARLLAGERGPWEAEIPFAQLRSAPFPVLVVSGAHHPAFDAVCDVLEERLGAERAVVPGGGHGAQRTGAPFNERLEAFLRAAEERLRG